MAPTILTWNPYCLPDVFVLLSAPETRYLIDAAFLVVEVLSEHRPTLVEIESEIIRTADYAIELSRSEIFAA